MRSRATWKTSTVGDTLGPIVRGPLRVVEISFRNWAGGGVLTGAGGMAYGGHYYQFEEYLRRPGMAEVEEGTGVMDHPHRGHWEESFARKIGVPGIYDIAVQRTAWMTTLMTNWAGDDGWVRSVNSQFRFFNVEGDTTWLHGTGRPASGSKRNLHIVDIDIRCVEPARRGVDDRRRLRHPCRARAPGADGSRLNGAQGRSTRHDEVSRPGGEARSKRPAR